MITAAVGRAAPDASAPAALAAWLAEDLHASRLVVAGAAEPPATSLPVREAATPADIAALGRDMP